MAVAGVTSDRIGKTREKTVDPVGAVKEADTSWTFTLTAAKAPPTSNGGQGLVAESVVSDAAAPRTPVVGLPVTPQEGVPAAVAACNNGSVPNPRPHAKRWRSPTSSRVRLIIVPLRPAAGPRR